MDVTLNIKKIDGLKDIDYLELISSTKVQIFSESVSYKIHTVHDLLFGIVKIFIRCKGFLFTSIKGVVILRNIEIKEKQGVIKIPILDGGFSNKTDYLIDEAQNSKQFIHISYSVRYTKEDEWYSEVKNSFVHKLFDLFLAPQRSSLIKNLNNLMDEASKGSPSCKFNILFGIYLIDKYMSKLNHTYTANIPLETLLDYSICIVEKPTFPTPISNPDDLEGALLRYKYTYKRQNLKEYLVGLDLLNKYKIIRIEKETEEERVKLNDFSFNTFLRYVFAKRKHEENEETETNEQAGNKTEIKNSEPPLPDTTKELSFHTKKKILRLLEKEIFYHDIHKNLKPCDSEPLYISELMSNSGYVFAHKILIEELLNVFNFAIAPYGNTWPTLLLKRKKKIDPTLVPDDFRRAILETLGIADHYLLSVSIGSEKNPDHIIFFDNTQKRLVLSFKGTSTSDETLHDLDCEYTTFYEGLTHKGIKKLAMKFIENRTEEIKFLLGVFETKDLLITGHSLGGSLATLISIIFNRENILKGFRITTISFSAAPVVSYNLAERRYNNLFTVNYGNDLIPRLSYGSVVEMKYVCCSLGANKKFIETEEDGIRKLEDIRTYLNQTQFFPKLYHPGRVYQLKRIKVRKKSKLVSLLLFKNVGLDFYENVLIIKHAPKHHMINHISAVLKECLGDYDELNSDCLSK